MPSLSAYNIIRIYSKVEDYETENKTWIDSAIWVRENGAAWTANSAVDENWVCQHCLYCSSSSENDAAYNVPTYANFLWTANLLNVSIFHVQIDLLFIIFVCSPYSLWATIMLLHHFGFVCALILGYPCTHFSCHWCKIYNHGNVLRRLTQISKRQRDPLWLDHEY